MKEINPQIKEILKDLYAIDPSLKASEKLLVKLVSELLSAKPNVAIDENFRFHLRSEIMAKIKNLESDNSSTLRPVFWRSLFGPALAGALSIFVIFFIPFYIYSFSGISIYPDDKIIISSLPPSHFGSLSSPLVGDSMRGSFESSPDIVGMGGDDIVSLSPPLLSPERPPSSPQSFSFVLPDSFSPSGFDIPVLRQVKSSPDSPRLSGWLERLDPKLINLKSFSDKFIRSIDFYEDRDFGYFVHIDFEENQIIINQNISRWPSERRGESDLSDLEALSIASEFTQKYKIPLQNYSSPQVKSDNPARDLPVEFRPTNIFKNVFYPLEINNLPVFDEFGRQIGMEMVISSEFKRVSSVFGLSLVVYESSFYPVLQSRAEIMARLSDSYNKSPAPSSSTSEITLGVPQEIYIQTWSQNDSPAPDKLLIPGLIFPIISDQNSSPNLPEKIIISILSDD